MKRILLSVAVLSAVGLSAQSKAPAVKTSNAVGIETDQARATLDVNGDLRVQQTEEAKVPSNEACPCFLVVDQYGVIKRVPISKDQGSGSIFGTGEKGFTYNGRWFNGDKYVKDRNFGDGEHDFIYKVIIVNGKKWLNNNLGADYANVHSNVFNPNQQATSRTDFHAYGSLFQWQREADGHELITWKSATSGTPKYGSTSSLASSYENAGTSLFITNPSSYIWTSSSAPKHYDLWKKDTSNNPCPVGYHVPTTEDWVAIHKAVTGSDTNISTNQFWDGFDLDLLKLTATGAHNAIDSNFYLPSTTGFYWCSTVGDGGYAKDFTFASGYSSPINDGYQGFGFPVRCLQD